MTNEKIKVELFDWPVQFNHLSISTSEGVLRCVASDASCFHSKLLQLDLNPVSFEHVMCQLWIESTGWALCVCMGLLLAALLVFYALFLGKQQRFSP